MSDAATAAAGSWRALLGREHIGTAAVLASGVALYATNEFLIISLLPSAVADIGGQRFYAWVTTVYLVGSVVAATTVNPLLIRCGPRRSYLLALLVFGAGTVACACAPGMEVLLAARSVQGVAGGLLAGLGYAVINGTLPASLWTRASAMVSAMWGVSTLLGPAAGGLFAQLGIWRWGFASLAVLTAATAALVPGALPRTRVPRDAAGASRIPVWSLTLLGAAALAVSLAGVQRTAPATAGLLCAGVGLIGCFLVADRRLAVRVLPRAAFGPGRLKWMYLTIGLLMAATMADMYVPLFGQRLAHLMPLAAGFLGAVLAVGWTLSEILSASLGVRRVVVRVVAVAPLVMAVGLASAAWAVSSPQRTGVPLPMIAALTVALFTVGAGVGLAWPHLSAWIMGDEPLARRAEGSDEPLARRAEGSDEPLARRERSAVDDPGQAGAAAAAINTVQLISGALGAGLAGVVVNASQRADAASARWLFAVFAVVAVLAGFTAYRSAPSRG